MHVVCSVQCVAWMGMGMGMDMDMGCGNIYLQTDEQTGGESDWSVDMIAVVDSRKTDMQAGERASEQNLN